MTVCICARLSAWIYTYIHMDVLFHMKAGLVSRSSTQRLKSTLVASNPPEIVPFSAAKPGNFEQKPTAQAVATLG